MRIKIYHSLHPDHVRKILGRLKVAGGFKEYQDKILPTTKTIYVNEITDSSKKWILDNIEAHPRITVYIFPHNEYEVYTKLYEFKEYAM